MHHRVSLLAPLKPITVLAFLLTTLLLTNVALAAEPKDDRPVVQLQNPLATPVTEEPDYSSWSLNIDNDLFIGGSRDRDYTGGLAFAVSGKRTRDWLFSLDRARAAATRLSGFERLFDGEEQLTRHTIEFGFTLFTPSDITIAEPIKGDHPYASLFFVANAAQHVLPARKISYQTVLTLGVLGLPLADAIQGGIHSVTDSAQPEGWDNQISDGGEPTARYSISVQKTLLEGGGPGLTTQFSVNTEANIGFTTDASVGFGFRWGRLELPWYTFNPHPAEYISIGTPSATKKDTTRRRETYLYAGANLKLRLYNAVLQGQFRDSEVTFDYDELNPVVAEGWLGFLTEVGSSFRLGAFVRSRTAEIDKTTSRSPVWGGFIISRSL